MRKFRNVVVGAIGLLMTACGFQNNDKEDINVFADLQDKYPNISDMIKSGEITLIDGSPITLTRNTEIDIALTEGTMINAPEVDVVISEIQFENGVTIKQCTFPYAEFPHAADICVHKGSVYVTNNSGLYGDDLSIGTSWFVSEAPVAGNNTVINGGEGFIAAEVDSTNGTFSGSGILVKSVGKESLYNSYGGAGTTTFEGNTGHGDKFNTAELYVKGATASENVLEFGCAVVGGVGQNNVVGVEGLSRQGSEIAVNGHVGAGTKLVNLKMLYAQSVAFDVEQSNVGAVVVGDASFSYRGCPSRQM